MSFANDMCSVYADAMSCDAQIVLAKKEVNNNIYVTDYFMNDPNVEKYSACADRGREFDLIHGRQTGLKFCFDVNNIKPEGEWTSQFGSLLPDEMRYNQWTRVKGIPCKSA
jgi:hypothetical protein